MIRKTNSPYIIRYNKLFTKHIQPYLDKEGNVNLQIINHKFVDEICFDYLRGIVEASVASNVLIHILKMENLEVVELMSDLREIRNDEIYGIDKTTDERIK